MKVLKNCEVKKMKVFSFPKNNNDTQSRHGLGIMEVRCRQSYLYPQVERLFPKTNEKCENVSRWEKNCFHFEKRKLKTIKKNFVE